MEAEAARQFQPPLQLPPAVRPVRHTPPQLLPLPAPPQLPTIFRALLIMERLAKATAPLRPCREPCFPLSEAPEIR